MPGNRNDRGIRQAFRIEETIRRKGGHSFRKEMPPGHGRWKRRRKGPLSFRHGAAINRAMKLNKKNFISRKARSSYYQVIIFPKVNFQKCRFPVCFYTPKGRKGAFELSPVAIERALSFRYSVIVFDMHLFHGRRKHYGKEHAEND